MMWIGCFVGILALIFFGHLIGYMESAGDRYAVPRLEIYTYGFGIMSVVVVALTPWFGFFLFFITGVFHGSLTKSIQAENTHQRWVKGGCKPWTYTPPSEQPKVRSSL